MKRLVIAAILVFAATSVHAQQLGVFTTQSEGTNGQTAPPRTTMMGGLNGSTIFSIPGDPTNGIFVQVKTLPAGSNLLGGINLFLGGTGVSIGQQLVSASVPVALPATQITALTPPTSVGISGTLPAFGSTPAFTISGTLPAFASTPTVNLGGTLPAFGSTPAFTLSGNATVVGAAASGASKSGNPVQVGGVFNTTQPTVTTGQMVESQFTARGAAIVGTGVDVFHVTVDSAPTTTVAQATGTNLHMVCDSGCSSSTAPADNSAFTAGTTSSSPMSGFYHSTVDTVTDGRIAAIAIDSHRSIHDSMFDTGGTTITDPTAHTMRVEVFDGTGTAVAPTTLGTHGSAITPASTTGSFGMFRASTATPTAVSADDEAVLQWADRNGRLHVTGDSSMTALKVDGSGVTQPVSGTFWQATQPVSGTVTANAGTNLNTSALALETGGNLAAINTVFGAKTDAKSTATDATSVSAMQVLKEISAMEQAPASRPVTNAGTFATQATLAAETTKVIGTARILGNAGAIFDQATGSAVPANALYHGVNVGGNIRGWTAVNPSGSIFAGQVDLASVAGSTIAQGHGTAAAAIRVELPTDGTGLVSAVGTLSDNGASATTNRVAMLPGIARSAFPSAATAGRDAALTLGTHGEALAAAVPSTSLSTYRAVKTGLAPAASATDIAVLSGNGTTQVLPTRVTLSCTQTTAGIQDVQLLIRTTADSGGTSTGSPTSFPLDQSNSAANSAVLTYTANPTINDGTARLIDSQKVGMLAPATAGANDIYIWDARAMGQTVRLNGTAQQLALNLNGTTISGASCDVSYQWIESSSY